MFGPGLVFSLSRRFGTQDRFRYHITDTSSIQGSPRYHASFGDRRHRSLASPPVACEQWKRLKKHDMIEGSLEVKLPTIWTDEKQSRAEAERRERVRRKKMQMCEKVGKSRNTVFFKWFGALEGRKVGSLKQRVRSHLGRWEMKSCTPLWREAHFQVKMYKTPQRRTTFGSWDVEKVHAVVARSTFRSQNVKNTRGSDHFRKLRCRKSARRCCAKRISKSKC